MSRTTFTLATILSFAIGILSMPSELMNIIFSVSYLIGFICFCIVFIYVCFWEKSKKGIQQQMDFVSKHMNIPQSDLQAIFFPNDNQPKINPKPKTNKKIDQRIDPDVAYEGCFFHGTGFRKALKIAATNYWLISEDHKGIWMGKTFKTARKFSGKDGAIIVLQVLSPLKPIHPSNKPDDYHVLRIKKGKPG
jgi:hypothetical protein